MNWLLATRAASHATVAAVITFNQVHNGELGLTSLALFGVLYLLASLGTHFLDRRKKLSSPSLGMPLIAPILVSTLAVIATTTNLNQLLAFRWLTALLMLGFVITELMLVKKIGRTTLQGREAVITAVASVIMLGIAIGIDVGEVPLVGFFGAYNAILAVHLGISAATPKK
jgi:predicted permease